MKYKIKPEYSQAYRDICELGDVADGTFLKNSYVYNKLQELNILDKWCDIVKEYEIGDWVVVKNYRQAKIGNGVTTPNLVTKLYSSLDSFETNPTGLFSDPKCNFVVKERNRYFGILDEHIIRKATPEEIESVNKPKLEIGKWYKNSLIGGSIFCITQIPDDRNYVVGGYGFEYLDKNPKWVENNDNYWGLGDLKLATEEEVETVLKNEAKKRGFKEGVTVKCTIDDKEEKIIVGFKLSYKSKFNVLSIETNQRYFGLFSKGKWAEIIKSELPIINGCKGKDPHSNQIYDYTSTVEYGCAILNVKSLEKILNAFKNLPLHGSGNRQLQAIKLNTDVEITIEEMKEIVDYYKNK
jgi:hypothetical protein